MSFVAQAANTAADAYLVLRKAYRINASKLLIPAKTIWRATLRCEPPSSASSLQAPKKYLRSCVNPLSAYKGIEISTPYAGAALLHGRHSRALFR
jgi:hypothetical protein